MAEGKNSFILYTEHKEIFDNLNDTQAGKLIKHVLAYVNDENPEMKDQLLNMAFLPIKQSLKRDLVKWNGTRVERVKSGKQGGIKSGESRRKKANKANALKTKQKEGNEAVNVNGNVSVNVNDNVNEDIIKNDTEIKKTISLHTHLRNIFMDYYLEIKDVKYAWDGKEATSLTRMINKLKSSIGEDCTDEKIIQGFTHIIKNIDDTWIMEHFTVSIINSNYNNIISKIKNHGKSNSENGWYQAIIDADKRSKAGAEG